MPLKYTTDVLTKLKQAGYNTNVLRKEKLLSESTIQKLRTGEGIAWASLETICRLLNCKLCDIVEYFPDTPEKEDNQNAI